MDIDNLYFQCLRQYITFEVMEGAYDISCPDPNCPTQVSNSRHSHENSKITFNSGSLEPDPDGNFNRQTLDGKTPDFPLKYRQEFTWIKVTPLYCIGLDCLQFSHISPRLHDRIFRYITSHFPSLCQAHLTLSSAES